MPDTDHLLPLSGERWSMWRRCVLRSAGFPVHGIGTLAAPDLARSADLVAAGPGEEQARLRFDEDFAAALARQTQALRVFSASPDFREAVAWQNLSILHACLDKHLAERTTRPSERRRRESVIARYVQRYSVKNDTIGFFGPVAWASCDPSGQALLAGTEPERLIDRVVYFENWAVAKVAEAIAAEAGPERWLSPRLTASSWASEDGVRTARGEESPAGPLLAAVLDLCDGERTVADIADLAGAEAVPVITAAVAQGILGFDAVGPVEAFPERTLRARIAKITDPAIRESALAKLDRLAAARDAVAAVAGDAAGVAASLASLNTAFEDVTGAGATRRPGETYAARTVVYEETTRGVDIVIGEPLLAEIARPMSLLLDAAGWAVGNAAELFEARFDELFDMSARRLGTASVPLAVLVGAATADLAFTQHRLRPITARVRDELYRRWADILSVPDGARQHFVRTADIEADVRRLFPPTTARWSSAGQHSPDIMIAAADADAVRRGEYLLVLGELHLATNTLLSRVFVERHPDPAELLRWLEADHQDRRIVPVPSRHSAIVNSRTYPQALHSPRHRFWAMHGDHTGAPTEVTPAAALRVTRRDGALVVTSLIDGGEAPLLEYVGEYLSGAIVNAFGVIPVDGHRPRVQFDKLVVAREAWSFPAADLGWAFRESESQRYREARAWRGENSMPERCFYRVPVEDKPLFVDFTSPVFVDILAKTIRQSAKADQSATVSLSEMLPDVDQCWLRDAEGRAYSSELRLLMIDSPRTTATG